MKRACKLSVTSLVLCHVVISAYMLCCLQVIDTNEVWRHLKSISAVEESSPEPLKEVSNVELESDLITNSSMLQNTHQDTADRVWKLPKTAHKFSRSSKGIKPVIILTYQRCGSSFFGNLFNFDKTAFYVFEPIDSLYSSLYGTFPGYNVPSDIVTYKNGSERKIPYDELISVAAFLGDVLSCDVDSLPTELLAHGFWHIGEHARSNKTAASVKLSPCTRRTRFAVRRASAMLTNWCGKRLADRDDERHEDCRRLIQDNALKFDPLDAEYVRRFARYRQAMRGFLRDGLATTCIPMYRSLCADRPLRVAKVVRASMLSMKPLLDWFPNLRIIHLVRDPRPVSLSRRDFHESARAQFSESMRNLSERTIREASIYCRQVVADFRWRQRLEREYPGRIYPLTYEQLTDDPVGVASDIYRFIGETATPYVLDSFASLASTSNKNLSAKDLSERWLRDRISRYEFDQINENCSQLFELFPQYSKVRPTVFRTKDVILASPAKSKYLRVASSRYAVANRAANKNGLNLYAVVVLSFTIKMIWLNQLQTSSKL